MKKISISCLIGLVVGIILSFLFMDYQGTRYEVKNQGGIESRFITEMDFNFIFLSTLLVVLSSIIVYIAYTVIEKKSDKKHNNTSNSN